jgi:hypothetical protein
MRQEPPRDDHPGSAAPARPMRRNITDLVYERLNGDPQTVDQLAEAVGGVRVTQIQAVLLRLGDKVMVHDIERRTTAGTTRTPGYVRADWQEEATA